ncbi:hypothetical protein Sjap_014683 [Stephania japonica]|uniref:Uncharacterized protein n=1 Tax=Stephania japonica TaxID=461633 RepID=A0AAP0NT98_9MAGN
MWMEGSGALEWTAVIEWRGTHEQIAKTHGQRTTGGQRQADGEQMKHEITKQSVGSGGSENLTTKQCKKHHKETDAEMRTCRHADDQTHRCRDARRADGHIRLHKHGQRDSQRTEGHMETETQLPSDAEHFCTNHIIQ